jgi:hypothetical protein
VSEFHRHTKEKDGLSGRCKTCKSLSAKATYAKDPEKAKRRVRVNRKRTPEQHRHYELRKRFKFGLPEFNEKIAVQGYKCAACGTTEPRGVYNQWHVDHDHACCPTRRTCGKCVRGLLCHHCNMTLGNARDSIERLQSLIDYLKRYSDKWLDQIAA